MFVLSTHKMRFLLLPALALGLCAGTVSAADLPDLQGAQITAATENGYFPFNFVDKATGQGAGWEYDVLNEAAKRLHAKIDWKVAGWDVLLQSVQQGQFDVASDGIVITNARKKLMDFSDTYLTSSEFAMVRADAKFADIGDLKASNTVTYGTQNGSANYDTAVELVGGESGLSRIKSFDAFNTAVEALKAGDVDVVPTYKEAADGFIKKNPDKLKVLPTALRADHSASPSARIPNSRRRLTPRSPR